MVAEAVERVRRRIAEAARRAGRDPGGVRLVCVTKGVAGPSIEEAIAAGATDLGENRVQEAAAKRAELGTRYAAPGTGLRWHMIGHLQRNKAKLAAEMFDVVHSADSPELIHALDRAASERSLELLIEVNISGEAAKHGCRPEEARRLAEEILRSRNLRWSGLMTMAPFSRDPEDSRSHFRKLRELRDKLQRELAGSRPGGQAGALGLSMGMSGDFEVAVEEGATMVRIGTAIFG